MPERNRTPASTRRTTVAAVLATLAVIAGLLAGNPATASTQEPAVAAAPAMKTITGSSWRAGDIISDSLFYDRGAMTASEIQTFLNAKIGSCTNGRCLNVVKISPGNQPAYVSDNTGATVCTPVTGGTMSVATWIYRVQVACTISAKVILATLQKEQGLTTSRAPSTYALTYAMGMNCPDTTGCSSAAGGLASQIYRGSRQLVIYKKSRFGKQPGVQPILYSPNSCGSSSVNVLNYATAALYNYTPYQPNAAALANLTGTGNSCSSYGNRNFWYYYSTWFGSTHGAAFGWLDNGAGMVGVTPEGVVQLWGSNGKGGWKAATDLAEDFSQYAHIQGVGDFDGDGHRDLMGIDAAGAMWIFPSDGLSSLSAAVKVSDGWGAYADILAPGDLTGDGRSDIVAVDAAGAVTLFPGTGLGGVRAGQPLSTGWNGYDEIVTPGDFSGDGRVDLIARDTTGKLWLYKGTGAGTLAARAQIGSGWGGFDAIVGVGDFTGDKRNDLMTRTAAGALKVYPGNGKGAFLAAKAVGSGFQLYASLGSLGPLQTAAVRVRTGAGDLKFDAHRDVLALDGSGVLWLYPGAGSLKFGTRIKVAGDFSGMTAIVGADDFDRNGSLDVIMRDAAGTVWSYPSNRAGQFGARVQVTTGWADYTAVLGAGDLNADRRSDLVTRDAAGALWVFPGDGDGGLKAAVKIGAAGWSGLTVLTPGDFDGDGNADLITIDASGIMRFYGGTGAPGLRAPVQIGSGWASMTAVFSPGDFSGDGNPDVIARDAAGKLWLYRGTGTAAFVARVQIGSGWGGFTFLG